METLPRFTARVVTGSGRGKGLGTPTLNLSLSDVPQTLKEGVYACFAILEGNREQGALHYGPRPVFNDSLSCEVHLLDKNLETPPAAVMVEVIAYLRPVQNFPSPEDLKTQIAQDIAQTRGILRDA